MRGWRVENLGGNSGVCAFRAEDNSDEDSRSARSEEQQLFSNPIRDEHNDSKTKISEMNEEKRSKLREIEVSLPSSVLFHCAIYWSPFHIAVALL